MELLTPTDRRERSPSRGEAHYFSVKSGSRVAADAAWTYPESPLPELQGLVRIRRHTSGIAEEYLGDCRFVKLRGSYGWEEP